MSIAEISTEATTNYYRYWMKDPIQSWSDPILLHLTSCFLATPIIPEWFREVNQTTFLTSRNYFAGMQHTGYNMEHLTTLLV
jgi:hypothetical protein